VESREERGEARALGDCAHHARGTLLHATGCCCESDACSARPGTRGGAGTDAVGRGAKRPKIPSTAMASARLPNTPVREVLALTLFFLAVSPSLCSATTHPAGTLAMPAAAKHTQGVAPASLCMAVASYCNDNVGTPPALCCLHACRRCAWISGHPLRKAPTLDRTGPGMAWQHWHGVAVCLQHPTASIPRDWVSRRGGESKFTNSDPRGTKVSNYCANTSSFSWT
jgi:hypothetical protein